MTRIGAYLAREIIVSVAGVLAAFLALFAFFDFLNELDDIGRGGYALKHAVARVVLGLPGYAYELMPVAVLIGAIWALAQFAQHSEFTAMRVAGLGRRRALLELLRPGLLFVAVTLLLGEVVAPPSERLAQNVRLSAMGSAVSSQFRSGVWVKDTVRAPDGEIVRRRFVNAARVLPDATIEDLRVYEFDARFRLTGLLTAATGRWAGPSRWQLTEVVDTVFEPVTGAGGETTLRARREHAAQRTWESELSPEIVSVMLVEPQRMSAWSLAQYVRHLAENSQRSGRYEIALWKKIVYPFACMVMLVLALPFAFLQARAGSLGIKVFAGIMIGVTFHFMNGLFSNIGMLNTWPPLLAVILPSALALVVGSVMLWWVDRVR